MNGATKLLQLQENRQIYQEIKSQKIRDQKIMRIKPNIYSFHKCYNFIKMIKKVTLSCLVFTNSSERLQDMIRRNVKAKDSHMIFEFIYFLNLFNYILYKFQIG